MKKITAIILTAVFLVGLGIGIDIFVLSPNREKEKQDYLTQIEEGNLALGKAQIALGEASKYADSLEEKIKQDIEEHDALITKYSELEAKLETSGGGTGKTKIIYQDRIVYKELEDAFTPGQLYQAITPNELRRLGGIGGEYTDHRLHVEMLFQPLLDGSLDVAQQTRYTLRLRTSVLLVEAISPNGEYSQYAQLRELDDKGEVVSFMNVVEFKSVFDDMRNNRFILAPNLDVGVFAGYSRDFDYGGSIGISYIGYGLGKRDLYWKFLRVGVNLSRGLSISITPVSYNIGSFLPLISNTWAGPFLGWNGDNLSAGLLLSVGL